PKGVVGIVSPWNYPLTLAVTDAVPAFLAGNAVVHKPDTQTAVTALWVRALAVEAGLPADLWQLVVGDGPVVGRAVVDGADFVCFTGSTAVGREVAQRSAQRLVGASLELGGKNPMVVLDDADIDETVGGSMFAVFGNTGQICMHIERIYLPDAMYDEFRDRFVAAVEGMRIEAAYAFGPDLGALISPDHLTRVQSHVEDAVAKGAKVLTGGKARPDIGPTFFEPTILEGTTKEMLHGVTETFGPVVSLHRYSTLEEAIELANDTDYGLNASVWTTNFKRAQQVAARIESGNVNINDGLATAYASKSTPSGGMKQSGVGARHGDQGLLKYTETQN
ncbi:MAG: succinic semialdehyde dehydrogenase, partial [Actinomycetes bacterium]